MESDKELTLLQLLQNPAAHSAQRDLAKAIGMSLGMTNTVLKKLTARGWLLMRKLNARKIQYALTPEGLKELAQRSYKYIKKTIKNLAVYKDALMNVVQGIKNRGYTGVTVCGDSELDFLVEYAAQKSGLNFSKTETGPEWYELHYDKEFQEGVASV